MCDKLANLEDIVNDVHAHERAGKNPGDAVQIVLNRFNGGVNGTIAYYTAVYEITKASVSPDASAAFRDLLLQVAEPPTNMGRQPEEILRSFAEATADPN